MNVTQRLEAILYFDEVLSEYKVAFADEFCGTS